MSFFRNIRSSITRGKSSSRDSTPVRNASLTSSRPGSVVNNSTSSIAIDGRRDSIDSRPDSVLNRGETFILGSDPDQDDQDDQKSQKSNSSSTLEKKSKKSKVLSKFSTFTKRKKPPPPSSSQTQTEIGTYEHHPSDTATNTYYKWNSDGTSTSSNIDYDAQSDPFNFLYEKHSNLKLLQHGIDSSDTTRNESNTKNLFDSSTYRKGKATSQLKAQLEQLKTQHSTTSDLPEEELETESDKYKTITLNSFRKSFREKYFQHQKEAPYNPSWFVEVDKPPSTNKSGNLNDDHDHDAKENRPDYIVFENDNYRPGSRSPVRDRAITEGRNSRSITRSPVKRNETFRVERSTLDAMPQTSPSIRVEIKNSVMPQITGRIVPVGVAKPMPMNQTNTYYRPNATTTTVQLTPYTTTIPTTTTTPTTTMTTMATPRSKISHSPQRNPYKSPVTVTQPVMPVGRTGRFQTLIQISGDHGTATKLSTSPQLNRRNRSTSTRIQFGNNSNNNNNNNSSNINNINNHSPSMPVTQKLNNIPGSRYSYTAPAHATPSSGLSSYELLKNPSITKPHRLKHTYFGGDMNANGIPPTRLMMSPVSTSTPYVSPSNSSTTTRTVLNGLHNYGGSGKLRQQSYSPKRTFIGGPTIVLPNAASTAAAAPQPPTTTITTTTPSFINRRDLHQSPRYIVPVQRRSRSPIKIPWR